MKNIIYWSPQAEESYLDTLEFILKKWTIMEAENFQDKVEGLLENLQVYNRLCPPSTKFEEFHKCVISEQTSMIYRIVEENIIEIIAFIDNRSLHPY
jgi:plasmid stabilization system protein ParE